MIDIDDFVSRLHKVKRTGNGRYIACCPAHDDKSPSLAVSIADNGTLLIKCFGGCGAIDVISAMGLEWSDILPDSSPDIKPKKNVIYATEGLLLIQSELRATLLVMSKILNKKDLIASDYMTVRNAMNRINTVMELTSGK